MAVLFVLPPHLLGSRSRSHRRAVGSRLFQIARAARLMSRLEAQSVEDEDEDRRRPHKTWRALIWMVLDDLAGCARLLESSK
ncbi:hypothetical protein BD414DRAFT_535594 [Trametes punicea]|nr:hypothetical protein BD414DRAFT_535594 [Trametes punicea]